MITIIIIIKIQLPTYICWKVGPFSPPENQALQKYFLCPKVLKMVILRKLKSSEISHPAENTHSKNGRWSVSTKLPTLSFLNPLILSVEWNMFNDGQECRAILPENSPIHISTYEPIHILQEIFCQKSWNFHLSFNASFCLSHFVLHVSEAVLRPTPPVEWQW